MKTLSINIYQFSELSEDAKKVAIEQWREGLQNEDLYYDEYVKDEAKTIGNIIGIDIDKIYYSGFGSQGDGACFVGSYSYAKKSVDKIREFAPEDVELHDIADRLYELQKRSFYGLEATVKHYGRYYNENSNTVTVYNRGNEVPLRSKYNYLLTECLRDFMRWIYKQLEIAYKHSISDESIIESIECNEIEFTVDGKQYY